MQRKARPPTFFLDLEFLMSVMSVSPGLGFSSVVIELLFDFQTCPNYQKWPIIVAPIYGSIVNQLQS